MKLSRLLRLLLFGMGMVRRAWPGTVLSFLVTLVTLVTLT